VLAVLSLAGVLVTTLQPGGVAAAAGDNGTHGSGITVETAPAEPAIPPATSSTLARAWSDAYDLAINHPNDFGYPHITRSGTPAVVVRATTPVGLSLAGRALARPAAESGPQVLAGVPRSFAELEAIKDEAIDLDPAEVPGADTIWMTMPDLANNRVLIVVDRLRDELLYALAARYGTEAIAVRVQPRLIGVTTIGRRADNTPFYGGSQIRVPDNGNCSDAFSWRSGSTYQMLTAGHCVPNGGFVATPYPQNVGTVAEGSRENWSSGGTTLFPGDSVYRGDLALIQLDPDRYSTGRIYRGGPTSTSSSAVVARTGWSSIGSGFCYGGYVTGEVCGFRVDAVGVNFDYWNDGVIRNAVKGVRIGTSCPGDGDSGGSIFEVNNGVRAKGVLSGAAYLPPWCHLFFTDINLAYYYYPGDIATQ
jgi:hypothetical protein